MKRLTMLVCLWHAACAMGAELVSVTTNNFGVCRQLEDGKIYRFAESMGFTAAAGESAMSLLNGTAAVFVPAGVKVTLTGGAADGLRGAGAGIEVATNATLYVYGDGELVCTGGAAACGASGAAGAAGSVEIEKASSVLDLDKAVCSGGNGGAGGDGGGGAGAGLGGRGGDGGAGASGTAAKSASGGVAEANDGDPGSSGVNGGGCGAYFVYGPKTFCGGAVTATNQTDGATGADAVAEVGSLFYAAFGGDGGGAGGDGGRGADVGGGGFGGFGGGAGGSGACRNGIAREDVLSGYDPVRGVRGAAGANGGTGADGMLLKLTDRTVNGVSVWKGEGDGWLYDALENKVVLLENGPYDVRGDVAVDGNGHYRVTFPDSPVVLWLEDGDYTFRLSSFDGVRVTEHCYSAVVSGAEVVSTEVRTVALGVTVNGVNVGSLMGDGWMYSPVSKRLTLDGSVPYVLSGYDGFGNVQVTVRGDAEVTLSNLRLGGDANEACFRVAEGAGVRLALEGTSVLQSSSLGCAGIRLAETARLEIDSCGEGATLAVKGGEGAPGVFAERAAALAVDGGLLYVGGGTNSVACIGGDEAEAVTLAVTGGTIVPLTDDPSTNVACAAVIAGGSIWPDFAVSPTNALGQELHRVTVAVGEEGIGNGERGIAVEGLEGYGLKDVYAIDGKVHFWLPDGDYAFKANGEGFLTHVDGGPATVVRPVEVAYLDADGERQSVRAYPLVAGMRDLTGGNWYVATGAVSTAAMTVRGVANLVLADGATLTADGLSGGTLAVYGQPTGCGTLAVAECDASLQVVGGRIAAGTLGGEALTVFGGTVTADAIDAGAVTIDGGNVMSGTVNGVPTNSLNQAVFPVMIDGLADGEPAAIGGLGGYGVHDLYPVGGAVCLYLPVGLHQVELVCDGTASVGKIAVDAEGGVAIGYGSVRENVRYLRWDEISRSFAESAADGVISLHGDITGFGPWSDGQWILIDGVATVGDGESGLAVSGTLNLVLADGAKLTVRGGVSGGTLAVYGQSAGCGDLAFSGCDAALRIEGGRIAAGTLGGESLTVFGGTVTADAIDAGAVTVGGGSVLVADAAVGKAPTNGREPVYPVLIGDLVDGEPVAIVGLDGYGVRDIWPVDGKVCLWLPNGVHRFGVAADSYVATVEDGPATGRLDVAYLDRSGPTPTLKTTGATALKGTMTEIGGGWFVVRGSVQMENTLAVNGEANLILADGAVLEARHCIEVNAGGVLNVFAQSDGENRGTIVAASEGGASDTIGGRSAAIGGRFGCACGVIAINGGRVTANCFYGAGVGSGSGGSGGRVSINGGTVEASSTLGAGIGAGEYGSCDAVTVNGGTVTASSRDAAAIGIGTGGGAVTIDGGSVRVTSGKSVATAAVNGAGESVYCVTVNGLEDSGVRTEIEGLEGYGTAGICPLDGKAYLWLPDGQHAFKANGVQLVATVDGAAATAQPTGSLAEVGYLGWNGSRTVPKTAWVSALAGNAKYIYGGWYVVTGTVTLNGCTVRGKVHLILADGATLTAPTGIRVSKGYALTVYAQSEGAQMGSIVATGGGSNVAGIGAGDLREDVGTITINGGRVTATGGFSAAGIGSGPYGNGGVITINGGEVTASGQGHASGIGSGYGGNCGVITINGGRVTATGGDLSPGLGIGEGDSNFGGQITIAGGTVASTAGREVAAAIGNRACEVVIAGGSVFPTNAKISETPKNGADGQTVCCVTVESEAWKTEDGELNVEGLDGYGSNGIFPIDGKVYLWLPNGTYAFTAGGESFAATVAGGPTTAERVAKLNALSDSVARMVASIDLAALMAAPVAGTANAARSESAPCRMSVQSTAEDGIEVTVRGGVPGASYTLCAASDLGAFADGAAVTKYGPEICGADGTVTFKNVRRPAERQGFFTIWSN